MSSVHAAEGVIKFDLEYRESSLPQDTPWRELESWRRVMWRLGLTGRDAQRYGGYAYGNVSRRTRQGILISGSQTGGSANLALADYALVEAFNLRTNTVRSIGLTKPSSESLSHCAIYEAAPHSGCVLHVHHRLMWERGDEFGWFCTPADVEYGTQAMADTLSAWCAGRETGIVVMSGHVDGVIVFGETVSAAGCLLLNAWSIAVAANVHQL